MQYGVFMMPSHPPEREVFQAHKWDLDCLVLADKFGGFFRSLDRRALHRTLGAYSITGPNDTPKALMLTKDIPPGHWSTLAPLSPSRGTGLPCRVPRPSGAGSVYVRNRFGGALPTDYTMFDVDGMNGQHRDMTREAIDIILRLWSEDEPFEYKGEFWNVNLPEPQYGTLKTPHKTVPTAPSSHRGGLGEFRIRDSQNSGGSGGFHTHESSIQPRIRDQPLGSCTRRCRS
ncbi:MAG: hypothetical protein CM1200mP22_27200 [Dehalococcoidia bacterium]|nr:MAG: hypothetical protein CM1200mP22_27200 [Dehalococcoidia bacterium]